VVRNIYKKYVILFSR